MSEDAKLEHRLAAIMATDVVGYSRLIQNDEAATLAALVGIRTAIESQITQQRGRIVNTAGDSVLAEFASAVEAVGCAMAVQQALASDSEAEGNLRVRIGIHMGDVVSKNGDLFGTAVNIAARLEAIADPGGIVVSSAVHDDLVGKLPATFVDLGMKTLKNIEQPIRVYSLSGTGIAGSAGRRRDALPLPDKPSIAVLPFENLSADRDQDYFADGMVEEIITALSRMRWLFVIARNSSFAYKGRAVDVKQVGRELGVRYLLEGSVRKAGNRVRITGQLVDASTGAHLWADRFDGAFEDIFDLQDQMTVSVVGAIAPRLEQAEIDRATSKPTESLDAYDYFLRGMASYNQWTRQANADALSSFSRAIQLDHNFAPALALAARCYTQRKANGWMTDAIQESIEAVRLARRAVELGNTDAIALCFAGWTIAHVGNEYDTGAALIDKALSLNPNLAAAWYCSGWVRVYRGEAELAIRHSAYAMRLSPFDPLLNRFQAATATAHFLLGRYDEASSWAEKALQEQPTYLTALHISAASDALAGRLLDAQRTMLRLRKVDPAIRVCNLEHRIPLRRPEDLSRLAEGLRLAGLPDR